jgi:uncharacterized iron-regulated membrane protein
MKSKPILTIAFAGALSIGLLAAVRQDIPPDLAKQAKITLEQARATALVKVPHGEVSAVELEKENGKLIYSFDIVVPKKSGVEEVAVDAVTGKVVAMHHETAKDERREKDEEKKEKEHPPRS